MQYINKQMMRSSLGKSRTKQQEYITKEMIGRGSFGEVQKCEHRETSKIYAVKTIQISQLYLQSIEEEASNMIKSQSEYVLDLFDSFYDTDIGSYVLVTPYYKMGSFQNLMNQEWEFDSLLLFFYEMVKGLLDLYKHQILHLDLKPENVLIKAPGQYVLCDLGCSRKMEGSLTGSRSYNVLKVSCNTKGGGTPEYSSPDMILDSEMTQFSDIWSLGVILFRVIFKHHPMYRVSKAKLTENINLFYQGKYDIKFNYESNPKFNPIIKMLERMLVCSHHKEKRTTWQQLLESICLQLKWPIQKSEYIITDFDNLLLFTDRSYILLSSLLYYHQQIEKILNSSGFNFKSIVRNICIYLITLAKELIRHIKNIVSEENHFYMFETSRKHLTKKQISFAERLVEQVEQLARTNNVGIQIGFLNICRERLVSDIGKLHGCLRGLRKPENLIEKIHQGRMLNICQYIHEKSQLKYENRVDMLDFVGELINS